LPEGWRLAVPAAYRDNGHIWNQFTLRVAGAGRRDALREHLAARGIGSETYYPITLGQQRCFAGLPAASREGTPVAERLAAECLSIPVHAELTAGQRDEVAAAVAEFFQP
jgi:dTDP-4-amino-4,6-dideoxygalactose transaminase